MVNMMNENPDTRLPRRTFLAGGALLGSGLLTGRLAAADEAGNAVLNSRRPDAPYDLADPRNTLYTACLQCNTGCGIKCKIQNGVVTKIDGNPFSPWTLLPHLAYATAVDDANPVDGAICPKGQAGLQTAYDPYRLRKVLKRAGKRGENKWITIPFEQAIREICDGGRLFADVPGEEDRHVEGLRDIAALRDPDISKQMEADVKAIGAERDRDRRQQLVEAFKQKHAAHLDKLIDPDHPDLGPKNNQIVCNWGRIKGGRGDFYRRFTAALGSVNAHGHTTVCQGSLYFTCSAISDQYVAGSFSGGRKFYWQADTENARFVLFVGANLFEGNYGPPNRSVRLTDGLATGRTRIAVADPRFSKLASKAWKWLPLKPGTDTALALAMIRWIIENDRHDATFLANANKAAAAATGETSWTNATWLVEIVDGVPGRLVRAAEIGKAEPEVQVAEAPEPRPDAKTGTLTEAQLRETTDGKTYTELFMTVMVDGQPTAVDPNDGENAVFGDLFVDATLPDGSRVKSGLQILLEASREHTLAEWAEMAGVREEDVVEVARELTSHGKQASVDIHRGPAQHTNGFYAVFCWMSLNMLLGNWDHKGGLIQDGGTYDTMGRAGLFDLRAHPGRMTSFGISSIRHGIDYEKTTLFAGYPARRNWYPLCSDVFQEVVPSIGDAYPYPVKALIMYMSAPTYSLPAGHTNIDILRDVEKLPLFIANDILVGVTSTYADYIFPDLSFLERWEFQGTHFMMANKVQPVRQPVMAPVPIECTVYGLRMPICFESMMLAIAEYLNLPGFGAGGLGEGRDLRHFDEFYLRATANLAFGEQADGSQSVPDADEREMEIFRAGRRHLPVTVYDESRWRQIVGEAMWPKVVYVLNRGGRFEDYEKAFTGGRMTHPYGRLLNMYQERTAFTIHSGTGERYAGYARHVPIRDYVGNEPHRLREGHGLAMITHRTISQTKSRTIVNPWLSPLMPDNGILVNPKDAARLGLWAGQMVKVVSATNPSGEWPINDHERQPMVGRVVLTETMRPGVISFALGFGQWASGSRDVTIDGQVIRGEARRAAGVHANAAMWTDSHVRNTCMFDPIGGSVSFYDTYVRLVPT
jgi:tetrathionate reductase subunit A